MREAAVAYKADAAALEFPIASDFNSKPPRLTPTQHFLWCEERLKSPPLNAGRAAREEFSTPVPVEFTLLPPAPAPSAALAPVSWERMIHAVEKVRQRLLRAAAALREAGVPYAVAGGNAIAAWVSRVDEAAVRNTRDVDILLRRADLEAARAALARVGFIHRHVASLGQAGGMEVFLDGPGASVRDALHIIFAGEKVHDHNALPAPDVTESEEAGAFQLVGLDALVRMKLTAFRDKDRTHLRDLLELGLVDESWLDRVPPELRSRLDDLLQHPEG